MGGVVTAELGSIFSKSCQILSPSGEEHLALPGQPVLLLLIRNQKCVSPDAAAQESRNMGHQHHRACVTLLGTLAGTKLPPGDTLPAESGFAWCSPAAHVSSPPGPHLLCCIIFSLKKSHVTGDGDLVVVAKGFGSCWQRSPLASLSVRSCPATSAAGSCRELGNAADVLVALGDANYHAGGPRGLVKLCHQHQTGRAGWTGGGEVVPVP